MSPVTSGGLCVLSDGYALCLCLVFWKQFAGVGRRVVLSCSQTPLIWLLLYKTHESGNLWRDSHFMYLTHHHIWCPPPVSVQHPCVSSYGLQLNGSHCVCVSLSGGDLIYVTQKESRVGRSGASFGRLGWTRLIRPSKTHFPKSPSSRETSEFTAKTAYHCTG